MRLFVNFLKVVQSLLHSNNGTIFITNGTMFSTNGTIFITYGTICKFQIVYNSYYKLYNLQVSNSTVNIAYK